ncbi:hypothetical protein [Hyphomonas pacifica]|uniref:hypothetical protein n=1 Tax=Hyphomonas pacifica TaxID=1280941 RepID=UPI000DC0022E|nr:hypothetical protein [Hyphomonas pacifica]RAN36444.1 hypothetical protein HY11_01610 [Hyphomonas pacifica]
MAIAAMLVALASANAFADISGLYVRGNQAGFETIQIVETSGGQLTGRYESYTVDESGKISPHSVGFDGSISKQQLVLHMKKSLDTLFTTQSISGEIHGNSLDLTWEGGAGTFQKANASERNEALEQLSVLSAEIIWMHKVERTEKTHREAQSAITELEGKVGPLEEWMDTLLSKHNALSEQYNKREKRLASMDAMNVNYDLRYNVENEMYQIESEFYSLESEVNQKRGDLNWKVDSAKRKLAEVMGFCGAHPAKSEPISFCQRVPAQSSEFDLLIMDMSAEFERWDTSVQ